MKVTTVEEMRGLDRRATVDFSIPESILMENAGHAAFCVLRKELGIRDRSFVVLCGLGNNGGDGLVVARKIHSAGGNVRVFVLGEPERYQGCSRANYEMLSRSGVEIAIQASTETVRSALRHCDLIVDALLGTGLTREVGGPVREAIEVVNGSGKTVLSLDIPSGVDGNSGLVQGVAVSADYTVTFGLPKRGNLLYPGAELAGKLFVSHISFPPSLYRDKAIKVEISSPAPLPKRRVDGHKGTFGDVLLVAGAANYIGAPAFAALSVLKAGGGYARLAAPRSVIPSVAGLASEVVFVPQTETASGSLSLENLKPLLALSAQVDFVVVGPGLTLAEQTQRLVQKLVAGTDKPVLIDGDGLTAVANDPGILRSRTQPTVLTPHVGEMSRLAAVTTEEIRQDPIGTVQRVAGDFGAVTVLKGAHSLIGLPDERVFINTSGNSGMASAGSGDVLTGTIAAMYGLGLRLEEAVKAGVFIHGLAGDLAARDKGEDGITARDVLDYLPAATHHYREGPAAVTANFYGQLEVI